MRHVHGIDVYDDQTDQWTRHGTPEAAIEYAARADEIRYVPTVRDSVATHYDAATYVINYGDKPMMLLGPDSSRTRAVMLVTDMVNGTDAIVIGTREAVLSGGGFMAGDGTKITVETTEGVWIGFSNTVAPKSGASLAVSLWVESQAD